MAYTNEQEALRNALWNFIGQLSETSAYSGDKAKQSVIALMSEEMAKMCKNEDGTVNMVVAKPIIKNASWLLNNRANDITVAAIELEGPQAKTLDDMANDIQSMSSQLNDYINKI